MFLTPVVLSVSCFVCLFIVCVLNAQRRGQVVYPSIKVKDAVLDGSTEVKIQLKTAESNGDDGSAEQTTWAALAFNFSDEGRKRLVTLSTTCLNDHHGRQRSDNDSLLNEHNE